MFHKNILSNNTRLITVPLRDSESVTVLILFSVGSKYENKKNNGISHFLEHMMFKGTKKRKNTLVISEELDRIGGFYNAFTSKDYTGYYVKAAVPYLDKVIDIMSDMLQNSKFSQREIEREKGVIVEEINMYEDMPQHRVQSLFLELLYGDQPAGWPIAGTKKNVLSFTRKDFLDYYKKHYIAENAVVAVAGNFSEKTIAKKVEKYFSKMSAAKNPPKKTGVSEIQNEPKSLVLRKKTDQTHIIVGARAFDMFDKRRFALSVLALILGGTMSSRMFISIREKQGLAYYIHTESDLSTDCGFLATSVGVDNNRAEKAVYSIMREYKKIRDNGVSKKELQKAKEYFKGSTLVSLETSNAWANFFGDQALFRKNILTPKELLKNINAVSQKDVLDAARFVFRPEKINIAVVGPKKYDFDKSLNIL